MYNLIKNKEKFIYFYSLLIGLYISIYLLYTNKSLFYDEAHFVSNGILFSYYPQYLFRNGWITPWEYFHVMRGTYAWGFSTFYNPGYWLLSLPILLIFGVNYYSLNFITIISFILLPIYTFKLGRILFNIETAFYSSLLVPFCSTYLVHLRAQVDIPSSTFWLLTIYYCIINLNQSSSFKIYHKYVFIFSLSFVTLLKQPNIIIEIVLFSIYVYKLGFNKSSIISFIKINIIPGLLNLIWMFFVLLVHLFEFSSLFAMIIANNNVKLGPQFPDPQIIFYYIILISNNISLIILPFLIYGSYLFFKNMSKFQDSIIMFYWFLPSYTIFSLLSNKQDRFMNIIFPLFYILIGYGCTQFQHFLKKKIIRKSKNAHLMSTLILIFLIVLSNSYQIYNMNENDKFDLYSYNVPIEELALYLNENYDNLIIVMGNNDDHFSNYAMSSYFISNNDNHKIKIMTSDTIYNAMHDTLLLSEYLIKLNISKIIIYTDGTENLYGIEGYDVGIRLLKSISLYHYLKITETFIGQSNTENKPTLFLIDFENHS